MLFGEAKYFTGLSTGNFFICRKFLFGEKEDEKIFGRDLKEDKNLQVDFGVPGALYHGNYFKCQVMHAGKNGLNTESDVLWSWGVL